MKGPLLRKVGGYAFAIVFVIAGWWLTALLVDSPALPTPADTLPMLSSNAGALWPFFWVR